MLQRIDYLMKKGVDFALETTLSTRSYVQTIKRAQQIGYVVSLYYFWIPSAEIAKERVAKRVSLGGHNIPPDVIERRYGRSVENLVKLYVPICDHFTVFNNVGTLPGLVASGGVYIDTEVINSEIWKTIQNCETDRS